MPTLTTHDIRINVESFYQSGHSNPLKQQFVHAYRVSIENRGQETVQLLRRHWFILDSNGVRREVEGEGVIGQQPILHPGQRHQYSSWSPLLTEIGKMYGYYTMQRTTDNRIFRVKIPVFDLVAPMKLN